MQLSAQTLQALCRGERPLISPFSPDKVVVNGKSYGLSAASYDVRSARDLTLGPSPDRLLASMMKTNKHWSALSVLEAWADKLASLPPPNALASTLEDFDLPPDVAGYLVPKSTWARMFSVNFNTFIDPGFRGNITAQFVNHSAETVTIAAGDPLLQVVFFKLDRETDRPYAGKYQNQSGVQGPRFE